MDDITNGVESNPDMEPDIDAIEESASEVKGYPDSFISSEEERTNE